MKRFIALTAAVALLALGSLSAKAETDIIQAAPSIALGGTFTGLAASGASMAAMGPGIVAVAGFMLAVCEHDMKKDANGVVIYQNPHCAGPGPIKVGSVTPNPYVPVSNPCTKNGRGEYVCAR